jgi:hypothetical protein
MKTIYTSIYLTPDSDDKLVYNTPYFESEVPSIIALKSDRLAHFDGVVIGGPASVLQPLEEALKKWEKDQKIIDLAGLCRFIETKGATIRYKQGKNVEKATAAVYTRVTA